MGSEIEHIYHWPLKKQARMIWVHCSGSLTKQRSMNLSQTSSTTPEIECYLATEQCTTLSASAIPRRPDHPLPAELHVLNIALLRRNRYIYRQRRREPDLPSSKQTLCLYNPLGSSPVWRPSDTYKPPSPLPQDLNPPYSNLRVRDKETPQPAASSLHTLPPPLKMHLPILLRSLLPLTSAFLVPTSLADGLYLAPINGTSATDLQRVDLDALVASHSTTTSTSRRGVDRRQEKTKYAIGRTDRMFPNHGDYNACTDSWRTFFANGGVVKGHFLFLCTYGEAVLAGCNYRSESLFCLLSSSVCVGSAEHG